MATVISVREGPLAVFGESDGKSYVMIGENTAEAKRQAQLAKGQVDAIPGLMQPYVDAAEAGASSIDQKLMLIQLTSGDTAWAVGWVDGDIFHAHTLFKNDTTLTIENAFLNGIKAKADLAPASYLSGAEQHIFVVGVQDSADATKAYVLFGVRSDGSLDSPEYNQILAEVLGSRAATKQQLQPRKAAYGFGQFGFRKALRSARGGGSVDYVLCGDSLTTNLIVNTLRRLFGRLLGFGGLGMLPWAAYGLGYDGTSGAVTIAAGGWTFWTYNPTATDPTLSASPPAGFDGHQNWWIKSGAWAKAGNGQTSMLVNAPFNTRPEYAFDRVRVFHYATGGDCAFRVRANSIDGTNPGPWSNVTAAASTVGAPALGFVEVTGFGGGTGRYRIDVEEQISGGGVLNLGGICFINSAGGVRFNRQSLGGFKAGDIAGQAAAAQAYYYANLPSGSPAAAHVHLAHNDNATADGTYLANMQAIITRLRTANPNCSIALTQWFSAAALKREAAIKGLAVAYDGTVFDVRDVIPSRDWAAARNLLSSPAIADDPHLIDDGYEHVGHSLAIHLGLSTALYNLQGY